MNVLEEVIVKLKTVGRTVRSESSKLLLEECVKDLTDLEKELFEKEQEKKIPPTYKIGDRVKLCEDAIGQKLSPDGKEQRFLINSFDHQKRTAWCVDPTGKENPRWIALAYLILADD
jgi:hypothetical protein